MGSESETVGKCVTFREKENFRNSPHSFGIDHLMVGQN